MSITRLQLKQRILSARGLTRARADGLLDDTLLTEAVRDAQELVVHDCNLFPIAETMELQADKWEYPVPVEWLDVREVYFIDASGNRLPLGLVTQDEFVAGRNPATDKSLQPVYYAFPKYQRQVIQPFAQGPPEVDYVPESWVTSATIRTVVDTAINFGKTYTGRRISPGDIVWNRSDIADGSVGVDPDYGSYGIVEVLDIITTKVSGVAGASTSATRLHDGSKTFTSLNINEGDLICITDADDVVITYGFVAEDGVAANFITYEDLRGEGSTIVATDVYKIGVAQKIRLSSAAPHRGLRGGANNRFTVGTATATLIGTTFTNTRVTGTGSLSSVSEGEIAIASGGSHGKVETVGSGYLDVDKWIGGVPAAGQTVTVRACDEYQVETRPAIERVISIGPTPTTTDALGKRSILILSNRRPLEAQYDWEELEVPEEYRRPLYAAAYWMAAELTGLYDPRALSAWAQQYEVTVSSYRGNANKTKINAVMSPWLNQTRGGGSSGRRYQSRNGMNWNVRSQLGS